MSLISVCRPPSVHWTQMKARTATELGSALRTYHTQTHTGGAKHHVSNLRMLQILGSYLCIFRRPARIAILGWASSSPPGIWKSREVSSDLPAFRSSEFPPESGPHAPGGVRLSSAGRQGPWRGDDDAIVLLCQPTCKSQQNCCRPSVRFSVPVFTAGAEDDARGELSELLLASTARRAQK